MNLTDRLLQICRGHILAVGSTGGTLPKVVVPEPYVPFVPKDWNRVLVLAEAQNLSNAHKGCRTRLLAQDPESRILRLLAHTDSPEPHLGIKPWDQGFLKLAVEAALNERAAQVAVSNAVLWSLVGAAGVNVKPSSETIGSSIGLWAELLPVLRPVRIVAAGKVAQTVVSEVRKLGAWTGSVLALHLPSPRVLSVVSGMFDPGDLKEHYPAACAALDRHASGWRSQPPKEVRGRLFYACHAVSMARKLGRGAGGDPSRAQ